MPSVIFVEGVVYRVLFISITVHPDLPALNDLQRFT